MSLYSILDLDILNSFSLSKQFLLLSDAVSNIEISKNSKLQHSHGVACLDKIQLPNDEAKIARHINTYNEHQYYRMFYISTLCRQKTLEESYNSLMKIMTTYDKKLCDKLTLVYNLINTEYKRRRFEKKYNIKHIVDCPYCFHCITLENNVGRHLLKNKTQPTCSKCKKRFILYICDSCRCRYLVSPSLISSSDCAKCYGCLNIIYSYLKIQKTREKRDKLKIITLYYEKKNQLKLHLQKLEKEKQLQPQQEPTTSEQLRQDKQKLIENILKIQNQLSIIVKSKDTLDDIERRVRLKVYDAWNEFNIIKQIQEFKQQQQSNKVLFIEWYPEFHKQIKEDQIDVSVSGTSGSSQTTSPPTTIDGSTIYYVESILDKKMEDGKVRYLLKWEGYGVEDASWEDEENCLCPDLIQQFETQTTDNHVKIESHSFVGLNN